MEAQGEDIMDSEEIIPFHDDQTEIAPAPMAEELIRKICNRSAKAGVVGLGYVGLPLAIEMARERFQVTGIDLVKGKVDSINSGISYVLDVASEALLHFVSRGQVKATQSLAAVEALDTINICVPTPLRKNKDPDLSHVVAAVEAVASHIRAGQLIILESTTYPGTTREVALPMLEKSGLKVGKDFFLAYSPERVDPGNAAYNTRNIPKIVGGITRQCAEVAVLFYRQFVDRVVPVSSPDCAEMVKLLENTFRSVNIALANEMAMTCHSLGINIWEVIDAAKTKPFGFMPFYPGPGLGGHCIPIDPYYLTWKARMNGCEPRLIELAGHINSQMPEFTVRLIADALNESRKSLKDSKILALGVSYKRGTNDTRESPALQVLAELRKKGAIICFSDPYVPHISVAGETLKSVPLVPETLQSMDCVVILTDHSVVDYSLVAKFSPSVVDTRNTLNGFSGSCLKVL